NITGVTIHDMQTSGVNPIVAMDLSGLANGSSISGNVINMSGGNNDIGAVIQYAAAGADVTFSGNTITTDAGDTGVYLYQDRDIAHPVIVKNNVITGASSATGILATDDGSVFSESPHVGTTYATLSGNTIGGYATGIAVATAGTTLVSVKIGGPLSGDANAVAGGGSGTGISVSGTHSAATIVNNTGSIYGFNVGVDVNGGSVAINGNHIYGNGIAVRFSGGGTGSIDNNNFAGPPDNGTDILLTS